MVSRTHLVLVLLVCVGVSLPLVVAAETTDHEIVFESDSVVIPEDAAAQDPVTVGGDEFVISSIGVVDPGDPIELRVETSGSDSFDVILYDNNQAIQDIAVEVEPGESIAFDTGELELEPGSYVIMVRDDTTRAIAPVVVKATDTEVTIADEDVQAGDDVYVEATFDAGVDPSEVNLIVWDGDERQSIPMVIVGDGKYVTMIEDVDAGEYDVYVTVHGDEEFRGEKLMIGISDMASFAVSAGDGDGGNGDDEATTTPTEIPGTDPTPDPTETEIDVITPTESTAEDDSRETFDSVPFNAVPLFVVAILALGLIARYRTQRR